MPVCESCREAPASVTLTRVEGDVAFVSALCARCASLPIGEHPGSVLAMLLGQRPPAPALRCPKCGLDFAEFTQTKRLGCPACYAAFAEHLEGIVQNVQYGSAHRGKVPARAGTGALREHQRAALSAQLEAAVAQEHYERAAQIRDALKALDEQA